MVGDSVLIYDPANDRYFAGWKNRPRIYACDVLEPIWTRNISEARNTRLLRSAHRIVETLGGGVRIVSETKARQMEAMKAYREAQRV